MDALIRRLKQPSTIKGLVAIAGLAGIAVTPEQADAIVLGLIAAYGIYQAVRDEKTG